MARVIESSLFVPVQHLPRRSMQIGASQIYEAFIGVRGSALIVEDNHFPLYLISAHFVKAAIAIDAKERGFRTAAITPLFSSLMRFFNEGSSFRQDVEAIISKEMRDVPEALQNITVVPIEARPLDFDHEEPERGGLRVSAVHNAAGQLGGWLFGDPRLADLGQTPPPAYVCQNDPKHVTGPDSGQCQVCGGVVK